MRARPRCMFLDSPYPFNEVYTPALKVRLESLVDIVHARPDIVQMDGVELCVGWDQSPVVSEVPDNVELVVHCGLFPLSTFPSIQVPDSWSDVPQISTRPGPRTWSNDGLRRVSGGHWVGAKGQEVISDEGPLVAVVSEPFERGIAEKILGVTIMVICGNGLGTDMDARPYLLDREFYDITVGVVGLGGAAPAFCRLLRNFEVGLMLYDPDIHSQPTGEMGAMYCEGPSVVATQADLLVLFPFKNPNRPLVGEEFWANIPAGSCVVVTGEDLVEDDVIKGFDGRMYMGKSVGTGTSIIDEPSVVILNGLSDLHSNSLPRVGREVVDILHRHVATGI